MTDATIQDIKQIYTKQWLARTQIWSTAHTHIHTTIVYSGRYEIFDDDTPVLLNPSLRKHQAMKMNIHLFFFPFFLPALLWPVWYNGERIIDGTDKAQLAILGVPGSAVFVFHHV